VIGTDASDVDLVRAAAHNHIGWMGRAAEATGGAVVGEHGLTWTAPAPGGEAMLLFPSDASCAALDAMIAGARERGARGIGCWATGLQPFDDLAERLMERDFEWGWQPHWMAIDLAQLPIDKDDPRVSLVDHVAEYGDGYGAALMSLARAQPPRSWHAVARVEGAYAGHAWAHLADGELGSAGIYDVDVLPRHRRRGLGTALTLAVCRAAADAGARVATLNATGEGELLYRALGFRALGLGQTWWKHNLSFTDR
jgi:GNAT superfamily N-acetyltransferase